MRGTNASATILVSSIRNNYYGGILLNSNANVILRNDQITGNGTNGIKFDSQSGGEVSNNTIAGNGVRGARGPARTGFNGIEFGSGWTGPTMRISGNNIRENTLTGIYIGRGNLEIINNQFYNNWEALIVQGAGTVNIKGNMFDMPSSKTEEEGVEIRPSSNGISTVTIGGTGGESNTFRNYLDSPAIHCTRGAGTVQCPSSGNVFINCNSPILNCPQCAQ
jgi:hypothetical protein